MSSYSEGCRVKATQFEVCGDCTDEIDNWKIPEITYETFFEEYYPQVGFSYDEDSVEVKSDRYTTTYERSAYTIMEAMMENLETIWIDGRDAPYSGTFHGHYLHGDNHYKCTHSFRIKEVLNETGEVIIDKEVDLIPGIVHDVEEYERIHFTENKETVTVSDKQQMLKLLEISGMFYSLASDELKLDYEVAMKAIQDDGMAYEYLPEKFKHDICFQLEAVVSNNMVWHCIPQERTDDYDFALKAVERQAYSYEYLSERLRNKKDIALIAIKNDSHMYSNLPKGLQQDEDILALHNEQMDAYNEQMDAFNEQMDAFNEHFNY